MFQGKIIGPFRFSRRGEYIGGRAASEGGPGSHTTWPLVLLRLSFGLRDALGKIGILAFVSSNFENISCIAFLKHKNSKNREPVLWHLISGLVLENA
jgi:hypothetical protein